MTQVSNKFDLEERTAKFSEEIICLTKQLRLDVTSRPIVDQLVKSATSIGANYMEANNASSKLDFRNKIYICKKEASETKYWLRMLLVCFPDQKQPIQVLWQECQELTKVFQTITNSLRSSNVN